VRRRDLGASVIAGYPWFAEGCRDAAIALPGLAIATARFGDARDVMRRLLATAERGLLPASFAEDGQDAAPAHPAADSSLWLFVAAHEYLSATGDDLFVRDELAGVLLALLDAYLAGTDHGIACSGDGMIATAAPGVPLTWMNARVKDWIATERGGTPVELAALWINALRIGEEIARVAGREPDAARYASTAEKASAAFRRLFWDDAAGALRDVVGPGGADATLRPNQVIALGLPHPVLPDGDAVRALDAVRRKLRTPVGLRTLDVDDPQYRGRYVGDAWLREKAYHQGSAWPWLLGAYVRACLRHEGMGGAAEARACLDFIEPHLAEAGIGTVSELFDGDAPHTPRGAIARCLSVAELLRALKAVEAA
jgi:predicted glycogen debranching enzyme